MSGTAEVVLDHEKLTVYERALDLAEAADSFARYFKGFRRHLSWQLHKAASSVPMNIAEGCGRVAPLDRAHFYVVALGSALECAAIMDLCGRFGVGTPGERARIRSLVVEIVRMLSVLSRNTRSRAS